MGDKKISWHNGKLEPARIILDFLDQKRIYPNHSNYGDHEYFLLMEPLTLEGRGSLSSTINPWSKISIWGRHQIGATWMDSSDIFNAKKVNVMPEITSRWYFLLLYCNFCLCFQVLHSQAVLYWTIATNFTYYRQTGAVALWCVADWPRVSCSTTMVLYCRVLSDLSYQISSPRAPA